MSFDRFRVAEKTNVSLENFATKSDEPYSEKQAAIEQLVQTRHRIAEWQSKLYAQNTQGLLVVLQGIDASGKDSTIKHVLSGVNPAGVRVTSFKVPSAEELDHDYLWRYVLALPARGMIGVFNRSHYEEVLVVRVHPQLLQNQHLDPAHKHDRIWSQRYREINHFEEYLVGNGFAVLKCFLHLSKAEQKRRFMSRLDSPDKNWKFSEGDVAERALWDKYQTAFEEMLSNTSTKHAPWYVVPADRKWFARAMVAGLIEERLAALNPDYPKLDRTALEALDRARTLLAEEA